jgi:hypothetical protein
MSKDKVYTAEMGQPPKDVDGASAGRKMKKTEPNLPEQPGSGIVVKKLAKGGSASSRADGCATKGKTRGTMIDMCGGGMARKK